MLLKHSQEHALTDLHQSVVTAGATSMFGYSVCKVGVLVDFQTVSVAKVSVL